MKDKEVFIIFIAVLLLVSIVHAQNGQTALAVSQSAPGQISQQPPAIQQTPSGKPSWAGMNAFSCSISGQKYECGVGEIEQAVSDPSLIRQAEENIAKDNIIKSAYADKHCLNGKTPPAGWTPKVSILPKLVDSYDQGVLLSISPEQYNSLVEEINCNS